MAQGAAGRDRVFAGMPPALLNSLTAEETGYVKRVPNVTLECY